MPVVDWSDLAQGEVQGLGFHKKVGTDQSS
jgi:hypothetical protein